MMYSSISKKKKLRVKKYCGLCNLLTFPLPTGMEVAAYLAEKAASISCIDITAVPFERVLGAPVGKMLQAVSEF